MALSISNNVTADTKRRLIEYAIGRYHSLNLLAFLNVNLNINMILTLQSTPILDLSEALFFQKLDQLQSDKNYLSNYPNSDPYNYLIVKDGYANIAYISGYEIRSMVFNMFTRTATESFLTTTKNVVATQRFFATNGGFWGFKGNKYTGYAAATSGPLAPGETEVVGKVIHNGAAIAGLVYKASPQGFYLDKDVPGLKFRAGLGEASLGDGEGGLTPMLIYNETYNKLWKYGDGNLYESGSSGPDSGDPGDAAAHITQRNNNQYVDSNSTDKGKCIFAWHRTRDTVIMIVEENGINSPYDLDYYRDALFNKNFRIAVSLDGSDSAMLYEYFGQKFHATPATWKSNANTVGIIFKR